jgi:hypothetical protein
VVASGVVSSAVGGGVFGALAGAGAAFLVTYAGGKAFPAKKAKASAAATAAFDAGAPGTGRTPRGPKALRGIERMLAALQAALTELDGEIGDQVRGSPAKAAVVAAMRKLLTILNALLRDQTPWQAA